MDPPFFADSVPAVLLNADPDPAAFLMRIRIQLKKCKTNNPTRFRVNNEYLAFVFMILDIPYCTVQVLVT